ncbi:transposase [Amycolatopsis thermoflava]|uniref:transposase n=1 Tax=Amycolatopsis thermoflava TaxID=84480 RepID=UPI0036539563
MIRAWSGRTSILLAPGKRGLRPGVEALAVDGEGLGRSRGGLSPKIHLAVDGRGLPMRMLLTGGHAGDHHNYCRCSTASRSPGSDQADRDADPIVWSRIRPTRTPHPAGDARSADPVRQSRARGSDRPPRRQRFPRRAPTRLDAETYKRRNVVERCFNRLKQFRDLATRYAKRAAYYQAELTIAAIILWLR